jgi:hypothetical protein
MKVLRVFSVFIVMALMLFAVTPALAAGPTFSIQEGSGTDALNWCAFPIFDDWTFRFEIKDFYDNQGNWIRALWHNTFTDRFYNPANGKEALSRNTLTQTFTPEGFRNAGLTYHAVVPGIGTVLIDAGYISSSWASDAPIVFHGRHMVYEEGDFSQLCAALQ